MKFNEYAQPIGHHASLNPKLWSHKGLKDEVRGGLLRIAEDFLDFINIPVKVVDIVIAGGNANYTYTNKSDLDLHIIADYNSIECDREVAELFDTKRLLYKNKHHITVVGIPVELYVEDHREPAVTASYSIVQNRWITPPSKNTHPYDEKELEYMIGIWKTVLMHAIRTGDLRVCRISVKLLRAYRKKGLHSPAKEFSIGNLVYKSLRNDNTLNAITLLIDKLHDQTLSVRD